MQKRREPKWHKPKLIVLTRGRSEETVLAYCKGDSLDFGSARPYAGACVQIYGGKCGAKCALNVWS